MAATTTQTTRDTRTTTPEQHNFNEVPTPTQAEADAIRAGQPVDPPPEGDATRSAPRRPDESDDEYKTRQERERQATRPQPPASPLRPTPEQQPAKPTPDLTPKRD